MRKRRSRQSARFLRDGDKYFLFKLARDLGKTVSELLTGRSGPLSNREYEEWYTFYRAEMELQKMARNKK